MDDTDLAIDINFQIGSVRNRNVTVGPTSSRPTGISRPTLRGSQHNAKRPHSMFFQAVV